MSTKDVNLVAKNLRITPFALMFGTFQNAIMHLSRVPRIITGVPYINRTSTEESECIGPFSNTIPILTERESSKRVSKNYLNDVQRNLIMASNRQSISANGFYYKETSPRNVDYTWPFRQNFNA
ncbi:condensation domain-containing protein [Staphylococcus haemolyticus]|uniref:condensation domain-containing protein n=1 Tax=Staphylococcus haemolyticus TaxID=1283 RepID=UPI0034CF7F0A